jgi:hypothetical protein
MRDCENVKAELCGCVADSTLDVCHAVWRPAAAVTDSLACTFFLVPFSGKLTLHIIYSAPAFSTFTSGGSAKLWSRFLFRDVPAAEGKYMIF